MFKTNKTHDSKQVSSEVDSAIEIVDDTKGRQTEQNGHIAGDQQSSNLKNDSKFGLNKKRKIIVIGILASILALIFLIVIFKGVIVGKTDAISVNNNSITKSQYSQYKAEYEKMKKPDINNDFNENIVTSLIYSSAAKQYNIVASDEDVNLKIIDIFGTRQTEVNSWMKFVATSAVNKQYLEDTNVKDVYAHYVFPFSRYFADGYTEQPIQDLGNQTKIKEDEKYAKEKANEYLRLIKADDSTANSRTIVEKIKKDSRLNYGFSGNNSEVFGYLANGAKSGSLDNNSYPSDEELLITKNLSGNTDILVQTSIGISSLPGYNNGNVPIAYHFYSKPAATKANPFNYDDYYKKAKIEVNVKN